MHVYLYMYFAHLCVGTYEPSPGVYAPANPQVGDMWLVSLSSVLCINQELVNILLSLRRLAKTIFGEEN